jgi:ubiquinone/menaquinone biosynthesis C-methylase UbiE
MSYIEQWKRFHGRDIPSSVDLHKIFFEKVPLYFHILDFGCGWGRIAHQLLDKGYSVEGFDINPHAVNEANKYADDNLFIESNAVKTPYEDAIFDTCILNAFLTAIYPIDRGKIIKEAFRLLNEDGLLYIADFKRDFNNPQYKRRYLADLSYTGELGTFRVYNAGEEGNRTLYLAHHFTEGELKNLIEPYFKILIFKEVEFTSYHGNPVKGFVILAQKRIIEKHE